ncbi:MAG TPA: YicC family protein, partial [Thiobacillaceae bacterium]|nr:YicC family protein [Thiobacillaceae bacterium]HNF89801.1 YicC family protein [Thiobacillaceae bacterium]HNH89958.1 YicC family protein [Thiobacillaceae bacterium]HNI08697.1 YicC family protein [Thiobacillaceae bacterium]
MKEPRKENLRSMTGYAVETADISAGQLSLELRAVNSRFLDLAFRMGEDFRALEPALRERIAERVRRGKLECRVNFAPREDVALPANLNAALLDQLKTLASAAQAALPGARALGVAEILRWPGMLGDAGPDLEMLHATALKLMDAALAQFNASRTREGDKLKAVILERVAAMREHVARIRPRTPEIVAAYREKLSKRLEELLPSPDNDRIHQEVALFAQKIDVDEELDRLLTHLDEVTRVLDAGGAAGKRLDFLMQELNREANTLGSKSVSLELTQTSVELKVLIEQMREQI